ncbi:hypothetical protein BLNAU_6985 [Blattamonas nauphoetae]|uniref:Uncharacterized protein n=1 Tax=Blattamonas nauphoetae TaxID=2049346 RepID=A0ABQ9Y322_9EUKA|nr:hypothetical protein BLNAU_6985 [Blattamonas nauphoetae]
MPYSSRPNEHFAPIFSARTSHQSNIPLSQRSVSHGRSKHPSHQIQSLIKTPSARGRSHSNPVPEDNMRYEEKQRHGGYDLSAWDNEDEFNLQHVKKPHRTQTEKKTSVRPHSSSPSTLPTVPPLPLHQKPGNSDASRKSTERRQNERGREPIQATDRSSFTQRKDRKKPSDSVALFNANNPYMLEIKRNQWKKNRVYRKAQIRKSERRRKNTTQSSDPKENSWKKFHQSTRSSSQHTPQKQSQEPRMTSLSDQPSRKKSQPPAQNQNQMARPRPSFRQAPVQNKQSTTKRTPIPPQKKQDTARDNNAMRRSRDPTAIQRPRKPTPMKSKAKKNVQQTLQPIKTKQQQQQDKPFRQDHSLSVIEESRFVEKFELAETGRQDQLDVLEEVEAEIKTPNIMFPPIDENRMVCPHTHPHLFPPPSDQPTSFTQPTLSRSISWAGIPVTLVKWKRQIRRRRMSLSDAELSDVWKVGRKWWKKKENSPQKTRPAHRHKTTPFEEDDNQYVEDEDQDMVVFMSTPEMMAQKRRESESSTKAQLGSVFSENSARRSSTVNRSDGENEDEEADQNVDTDGDEDESEEKENSDEIDSDEFAESSDDGEDEKVNWVERQHRNRHRIINETTITNNQKYHPPRTLHALVVSLRKRGEFGNLVLPFQQNRTMERVRWGKEDRFGDGLGDARRALTLAPDETVCCCGLIVRGDPADAEGTRHGKIDLNATHGQYFNCNGIVDIAERFRAHQLIYHSSRSECGMRGLDEWEEERWDDDAFQRDVNASGRGLYQKYIDAGIEPHKANVENECDEIVEALDQEFTSEFVIHKKKIPEEGGDEGEKQEETSDNLEDDDSEIDLMIRSYIKEANAAEELRKIKQAEDSVIQQSQKEQLLEILDRLYESYNEALPQLTEADFEDGSDVPDDVIDVFHFEEIGFRDQRRAERKQEKRAQNGETGEDENEEAEEEEWNDPEDDSDDKVELRAVLRAMTAWTTFKQQGGLSLAMNVFASIIAQIPYNEENFRELNEAEEEIEERKGVPRLNFDCVEDVVGGDDEEEEDEEQEQDEEEQEQDDDS